MTWLESSHLWNDSDLTLTRVITSDSSNDTHTRTRFSTWIMWSCEPWLCPHLILGEKISNWYYLVTCVNIEMVHSTPLRVFMYGHWDDHAVYEIFLSLYKRGIHYTILTWVDLKEKITWLDLNNYVTWLEKNSNDLTRDSSTFDLSWLVTRARVTCYNTGSG